MPFLPDSPQWPWCFFLRGARRLLLARDKAKIAVFPTKKDTHAVKKLIWRLRILLRASRGELNFFDCSLVVRFLR